MADAPTATATENDGGSPCQPDPGQQPVAVQDDVPSNVHCDKCTAAVSEFLLRSPRSMWCLKGTFCDTGSVTWLDADDLEYWRRHSWKYSEEYGDVLYKQAIRTFDKLDFECWLWMIQCGDASERFIRIIVCPTSGHAVDDVKRDEWEVQQELCSTCEANNENNSTSCA